MDEVRLRRRYEMECAHQLTAGVPEGHPCRRLHGHRYVLTLEVTGPLEDGMVVEYGDLDGAVRPVLEKVDHWSLNNLGGRCDSPLAKDVSVNPTVELLALWFAYRVADALRDLQDGRVRLCGLVLEEDSRASVALDL